MRPAGRSEGTDGTCAGQRAGVGSDGGTDRRSQGSDVSRQRGVLMRMRDDV